MQNRYDSLHAETLKDPLALRLYTSQLLVITSYSIHYTKLYELIREMATVKNYSGNRLALKAAHCPKLGDSIAINGTCLSVVSLENDGFSVELSPETQKHIATENLQGSVHIEPAT